MLFEHSSSNTNQSSASSTKQNTYRCGFSSIAREHDASSLVPRPRPKKSEEGPVRAESAVSILDRPIAFVHFQLPCQLIHSVRRASRFTGEQRGEMDMIAGPRLALKVVIGEANAAIKGAVRRLGYNVPTTEQKDAVTASVMGRDVFIALRTSDGKSLCHAWLPIHATRLHVLFASLLRVNFAAGSRFAHCAT